MNIKKKIIPVICASLFAAPAAHASIDLIAIGSLNGTFSDLSSQTSGPLENGVAGNLLGGLGSGIAWAGGNTFISPHSRARNLGFDAGWSGFGGWDGAPQEDNQEITTVRLNERANR